MPPLFCLCTFYTEQHGQVTTQFSCLEQAPLSLCWAVQLFYMHMNNVLDPNNQIKIIVQGNCVVSSKTTSTANTQFDA